MVNAYELSNWLKYLYNIQYDNLSKFIMILLYKHA